MDGIEYTIQSASCSSNIASQFEDVTDSVSCRDHQSHEHEVMKCASIPSTKPAHNQASDSIAERCKTYKDWPLYHYIKPFHLAKAGFIYLQYGDLVECVECKIRLKHFEPTDIPMLEHTRWSPKCPLVRKFFQKLQVK